MRFHLENYIDKINIGVSYVMVLFLWAPHAARECPQLCDGPYFISPMLGTFIMPNWIMDLSLKSWLLQILFAPPLLFALYLIFRYKDKKHFSFLKIYAVRWLLMWFVILAYYNLVFWSIPFRELLLPVFSFIPRSH
jgi:hypothetical protein